MPRANRYIIPGRTYHITHRCHNRDYLFRFAKDRDQYRKMLRERLQHHSVSLFGYCITSNHTHLLLHARGGNEDTVPRFMQSLEGAFAQFYNLRKKREGAFWRDRYHAVMIDSGEYLWACLKYIDLNMIRAGVVKHPREWSWNGYQELVGEKRRNRLIDINYLVEHLGAQNLAGFQENYKFVMDEALRAEDSKREARWTESIAVGSQPFVEKIGHQVQNRMQVLVEQDTDAACWTVRETPVSYG